MRRCAFLTLADPTGYVIDDQLVYPALADLGWRVEAVPWTQPAVEWSAFDAVVIRSTWDYIGAPARFVKVLRTIEKSGAPLFNRTELVRWNLEKTYLRDLAARGVPIVPTLWRDRLRADELLELFETVGAEEVVIKPVIGANASGAFRLDRHHARSRAEEVAGYYADRQLMAQPFLRAIPTEGEFSLFYFNGEHSHTILKTPKPGDFRVQEEHGGQLHTVEAEPELAAAGALTLAALDEQPLYARADFVRANSGGSYWLMELELIEPSLYFRMDPAAPARFARALHERASNSPAPRTGSP